MTPEVGPFQAFYDGPIQHPWLLWAAAGLALGVCLGRRGLDPGLRRYLLLLVGLSGLDAWLTSAHVYGLGTLAGWAARLVPLFFVLAGDFRFWLIVTGARADGVFAPGHRALLAAGGLTLIVPLFTQGVLALLPEGAGGARVMFLVYEVAFAALVLCLQRWHPGLQTGWIRSLGHFVVLYYALWACADGIILGTGSDLGFGLRVLPNLLYYGGFIAACAALAPGGMLASRRAGHG